ARVEGETALERDFRAELELPARSHVVVHERIELQWSNGVDRRQVVSGDLPAREDRANVRDLVEVDEKLPTPPLVEQIQEVQHVERDVDLGLLNRHADGEAEIQVVEPRRPAAVAHEDLPFLARRTLPELLKERVKRRERGAVSCVGHRRAGRWQE